MPGNASDYGVCPKEPSSFVGSIDRLDWTPQVSDEGDADNHQAPSGKDLLGCWLDSYGNTVLVQSANAQLTQLTARLSRAPRPDIHLSMWEAPDGTGWYCGEAKIDLDHLQDDSVTWIFPDGRRSVWVWQAYTLEALQLRGLALPHGFQPGFQPQDLMQGVWVPVAVAS